MYGSILNVEAIGYPDGVVPVGEWITLRVQYRAANPEQPFWSPWWTVTVAAKGDGLEGKNDVAHYGQAEVTLYADFHMGEMPDRAITFDVRLFGNSAAYQSFPMEEFYGISSFAHQALTLITG